LRSAEIPNLKEIYRDEAIGVAGLHIVIGKLVLHSEIFGRPDRLKLDKVLEIATLIDERLAAKGVTELYTWAETDEQYRWNLFTGFKPTGEEVVFDPPYVRPVYEFKKELI
jgi:hypothetical protein